MEWLYIAVSAYSQAIIKWLFIITVETYMLNNKGNHLIEAPLIFTASCWSEEQALILILLHLYVFLGAYMEYMYIWMYIEKNPLFLCTTAFLSAKGVGARGLGVWAGSVLATENKWIDFSTAFFFFNESPPCGVFCIKPG